MHPTYTSLRRGSCLLIAGASLVFTAARVAADDASAQADAFPSFESYVKVSGQAPFISGDKAAFATRSGTPAAGSGGIEDLFYTKDTSDNTTVEINGRALGGAEDYLASVNVTTANVGSVEVGYKRFRTFYDGVGGFFPSSNLFEAMSDENLHVDRSSFWVDLKLAKPNCPVFSLSFRDEIRTGQKDSTEWGPILNPAATVSSTGALVGTALPTNTPYLSPNVLNLDEHHKIAEGSMVATLGKTTETFKATLDWVNNVDSRDYEKYPNAGAFYAGFPAATPRADPTVSVLDDEEAISSKTLRLLNQTETTFTDWLALDVGLTYSHLSSDNGGMWITPSAANIGTTAAPVYSVWPATTAGDIQGGASTYTYVGNVFLKFTPTPNWLAEAGFREESSVVSSEGSFDTTSLATGSTSTVATNITTAVDPTYSHYLDHISTPEVTLQYTGFDRLSLYATADDRIDKGNQHWINPYAATTTTGTGIVTLPTTATILGDTFFQAAHQDNDDAKIGANWNQSSVLSIRAEVFRKDHQNEFTGSNVVTGTGSVGGYFATGYTFTGVKLSVILRPLSQLSFNTLYQPQIGHMSVTANAVNGGLGSEITSGKASSQMVCETVDWNPNTRVYLQGNISVAYNYIQTAYPIVQVVSTTPAIATPVLNANNNYVSGSALAGFVLDKSTDAQLRGTWQQATNYNPQIAQGGEAYGATYMEQSVTGGLKHKFSDRLVAEGKLGYLQKTDATTGGFTNYRGPLAYLSVTMAL